MAVHKKAKKATKHKKGGRRKKMGALSLSPTSPLVKFLPIVAGYFIGDKINDKIDEKIGDKVNGKVVAGGELAAGYVLAFTGKKSTMKSVLGGLLIGMGAKKMLKETGVITGFYDVPVVGGFHNVPAIAGTNIPANLPAIAGLKIPAPPLAVMQGFDEEDGSGINSNDR